MDEIGIGNKMIQPLRSATVDEFVAYPSSRRIALLLLGGIAFTAIGLWLAGAFGPPPVTNRYPVEFTIALGWCGAILAALSSIAYAKRLFDTHEYLRIGPTGVRWALWSDKTIPWSEVANVTTWSFKRQ